MMKQRSTSLDIQVQHFGLIIKNSKELLDKQTGFLLANQFKSKAIHTQVLEIESQQ
jgi:hypothetical protein